jgi:hypothetical protein
MMRPKPARRRHGPSTLRLSSGPVTTHAHRGRPPSIAQARADRIDQLAAVAAAHLETFFEGAPKTDELAKAKAALDAAVELAARPLDTPAAAGR